MVNFNEFEPVGRSAWQKEAERLLKGKPLSKLNWTYEQGMELLPYYDKTDLPAQSRVALSNSLVNGGFLLIEAQSLNRNTNKLSQMALNSGADGVFIEAGTGLKDHAAIKQIWPEHCWFGISSDTTSLQEINSFFESRATDHHRFHGFVGTGWLSTDGAAEDIRVSFDQLLESTIAFRAYGHIKTIEVPLYIFQQQGASITLELSILLGLLKAIIDQAQNQNIAINDLPQKVLISTAVGTDFYHEIAKIRAIRILAYKLFQAYDIDCQPHDFMIAGRTSSVVESALDADTNYLRKTTQALSIVYGTADLLMVVPYEPNGYDQEARRTSRNIGNLIREETYGHWVQDPMAGSYFIEALTDRLSAAGWERFRKMEAESSLVAWINDGHLSRLIAEDKAHVRREVNSRKRNLVGVNNYPNLMEDPLVDDVAAGFHHSKDFETLRYQLGQAIKSGELKKLPEVQPLMIGTNAPMMTARLNFATNFLGCAGFKLLGEKTSLAANATKTEMVVVCGSDDDYALLEQSVIDECAQKADVLILAGNPPNADNLTRMGIDVMIHMKSDLLESLNRIIEKLKGVSR